MSEDNDKPVAYLSGQVSAAEEAPVGAGGDGTVEVYGTLGGEVAAEPAGAGAPTQAVDADGQVVGMIGGQVQPPPRANAGAPTEEVSGMIGGRVQPPPRASAAPVGELEGQTEAVEGYLPSSPEESVEGYLAPPSESVEGYLAEEPAPVDLGAQSYSDYDGYGASQPEEGYEDYEEGYEDSYENANETATAEYEDSYEDSYGASSVGADESLMDDFDESLPQTISQQDAENIINRITRQKYDRAESQPRAAPPKTRSPARKSSAGIVIMLLLLVILGGGVAAWFLYIKPLYFTEPVEPRPIGPIKPINVKTPDQIAEEVFRAGALASELNAFGVSESDLERGRGDTIPKQKGE